ncbi:apoptotic chromatin condensation inducer 1b isoform X3 [Ictalurus furcatus]|uniref:apoptotic chromatin condensation inducer 1b isoform X3 n=1 Tax=Ictalurus furcatus TaxID=66913 RepID=UPI00235025CD|nr:apoptotic chromatin condensation inducer 1b isoform X3 [Ictalurus furcatus]
MLSDGNKGGDVKQATVAEPTGPVSMELQEQPESESALAHPASQEAPETSESRPDESTTPKAFAARKISLTTAKPEGAAVEAESGGGAGRKRRWGSSTAVTAKKPSISITTESLKSLIPDLKPLQEAVVDLHPDEGRFSGDEDSSQQPERDEDQGLQIRRTVTQVVPSESQENGQKEKEEDEDEEEEQPEGEKEKPPKKPRRESSSEVAMETQEGDTKKVTPNDSVVRRSISQQKVAVSITIDDPVRTGRQLSPPRGKTSNIIHVCNLVRPFTLGQLKELLNRTGAVVEDGFWIDKIKSHCYVTYASTEEAVATREALHGVKWPSSNPKVLRVDFCEQKELDFHKGLLTGEDPRAVPAPNRPAAPPPLMPPTREKERERERERDGATTNVRDQWAEREREMERRERTRSEREWDRDKVRDFTREEREAARRSRSRDRERRRKERGKSKEKKSEKKDKPEEPPAKLLDDLFRKTKAAPCIYWLPLTEEQATQKSLERAERMKEREKRRKELQEEEDKKREEERKERARGRERDGGNAVSSGGGSSRPSEGEKDKERERERDRERERGREKEGEKRRDSNRGRGNDSKPAGGSRRSRSHSNPSRDRRR